MSDLHAVLTARIDEEQAYVNRLHAEGATRDRRTHNLAVIVWRGLAEDRDILRRHGPGPRSLVEDGYEAPTCVGCGRDDFGDPRYLVPCPEWLSLARRHNVEVPE